MITNVLFNALGLNGNFSGVQVYSFRLLQKALTDKESPTFFDALLPKKANERLFDDRFIPCRVSGRFDRIVFEQLRLSGKQIGHTLFHAPASILPFKLKMPSVLTVHDTIPLDFPQYYRNSRALYFRFLLRRSMERADRIIAVSRHVKADILRHCPKISEEKITVVYHGIDERFTALTDRRMSNHIRARYSLPQRYMLCVGNIEPRKNLPFLFRTFHQWSKKTDHRLVIAGQWGWKHREVIQTVRKYSLEKKIRFLDYVRPEDLPYIYSMADLFLFPSLYEGFGFPPLEAMACGVPVLASESGAIPEIAGESAYYADPRCPEQWVDRMEQILNGDQKDRVRAGILHSKNFTWDKTWEQTRAVYNSMMK